MPPSAPDRRQAASSLSTLIANLDEATVRSLLLDAAQQDPDLAHRLAESAAQMPTRRAEEEDFDDYEGKIGYLLNSKYSRCSGYAQWGLTGDVREEIEDMVTKMASRCTLDAHYNTKVNAIYTLCNIIELVVTSPGEIPRLCRQELHISFGKNIAPIFQAFTPEELDLVCDDSDVADALKGARRLARSCDMELKSLEDGMAIVGA